jgi:hypothetical protein
MTYYQKLAISFLYKEMLGSLGVIASHGKLVKLIQLEGHRKEIVNNDGLHLVIECSKLNINKPKILKTALGCLINLAASTSIIF